ncbi:hypothetical protein SLA2020_387060 [Shorea laevis]
MEGLLYGIEVGKGGLAISLLQFADDTVIIGRADSENVFMVKTILRWFELMSGLRINFHKSSLYGLNVSERWVKGAAGALHCGVGEFPFIYLGMPVGGKPRSKRLWEPVVKKFRAKLAVWKSAVLSFGGRLTLLNSVLSAMPTFYMSIFLIPKSVMDELVSIQRNFLWGGPELKRKISWVKWDVICYRKEKGGLGVPDLKRRNWALLGKWWFRLGDGVESLWKQVLRAKYYGGKEIVDITAVDCWQVSKIWGDIIRLGGISERLRHMLVKGFRWEVGNGRRVGFWRDIWVCDKALYDLCPKLYALSMNKEGKVSEMGDWVGGRWCWNLAWRRERLGRERDEEAVLREFLGNDRIEVDGNDCRRWVHAPDGNYMVKNAYEFLAPSEYMLQGQICRVVWCNLVPSKVSFFGWRLCLDRLPTKRNLYNRGIVLQEGGLLCSLCNEVVEDVNHLFCTCKEVWLIWAKVMNWWGVESVLPSSVGGIAEFFSYSFGRIVGKEMGACIFLIVSWYL